MQQRNPIRVQKVIADCGLASRREAEIWISEGRITVNGAVAQLGDRCLPEQDRVEVDGRPLPRRQQPKVVMAMHKPKGYLCTNADPHANRTVFDLLTPEILKLKLSCVGRLDKESEGLLLLTNDGELQQQLTHPSFQVRKVYHVTIDQALRSSDLPKLLKGIRWEDEHLSVERVFPLKSRTGEDWTRLEVTLHHGKKREIRRLFFAFGYDVKRLCRVQIGGFRLKGIPRGAARSLTKTEIKSLFLDPADLPKEKSPSIGAKRSLSD